MSPAEQPQPDIQRGAELGVKHGTAAGAERKAATGGKPPAPGPKRESTPHAKQNATPLGQPATRPATRRGRGRPPGSAGAVVTRDALVECALGIAGSEGFGALSMHRLARELQVSTRALYHHVRDRQEVIDAVAQLMMQRLPEPHLVPGERWRESLREAYHEARAAYRQFPRAILISLDETLTPRQVDPHRIALAEDMLGFFVALGLDLHQAIALREAFLVDVFGFVLSVDVRGDAADPAVRPMLLQPVPEPWLAAHPEVPAPLARQASTLVSTSDALFDDFVNLRIAAIERLLQVD